jgi:hypothetical protein
MKYNICFREEGRKKLNLPRKGLSVGGSFCYCCRAEQGRVMDLIREGRERERGRDVCRRM